MARIRSIKPEFWTSAQVMDLSVPARLLFVGLWNFCDDAGIHPASEKRLKAEVFPADDVSASDVRGLIAELERVGLVAAYAIDGESYWRVTGWHHQKIDQPTFKYPRPDGSVPAAAAKRRANRMANTQAPPTELTFGECSSDVRRTVDEQPANVSEAFGDCSLTEGSRRESSRCLNLELHLDNNLASSGFRRAFAARLDMTIERAKVSSRAVVASVGAPERDMALWRAGVTVLTGSECRRLSEFLRVNVDWLTLAER